MSPPFPETDKALVFAARKAWEQRHFLLETRQGTDNLPGSKLTFCCTNSTLPLKHALIAVPEPSSVQSLEEVCKKKKNGSATEGPSSQKESSSRKPERVAPF